MRVRTTAGRAANRGFAFTTVGLDVAETESSSAGFERGRYSALLTTSADPAARAEPAGRASVDEDGVPEISPVSTTTPPRVPARASATRAPKTGVRLIALQPELVPGPPPGRRVQDRTDRFASAPPGRTHDPTFWRRNPFVRRRLPWSAARPLRRAPVQLLSLSLEKLPKSSPIVGSKDRPCGRRERSRAGQRRCQN